MISPNSAKRGKGETWKRNRPSPLCIFKTFFCFTGPQKVKTVISNKSTTEYVEILSTITKTYFWVRTFTRQKCENRKGMTEVVKSRIPWVFVALYTVKVWVTLNALDFYHGYGLCATRGLRQCLIILSKFQVAHQPNCWQGCLFFHPELPEKPSGSIT